MLPAAVQDEKTTIVAMAMRNTNDTTLTTFLTGFIGHEIVSRSRRFFFFFFF
jgi:hypothetical protein